MKSIKNIWRNFAGKGYYIALILTAVAIGAAGILYYRSADTQQTGLQTTEPTDLPALSTDATQSDAPANQTDQALQTAMPLSGQTVMAYSMEQLSYDPTTRDWRTHAGIDIAAEAGAEVCAAADGVVYTTYDDELLGTTVVIRHQGDYTTTYASLSQELEVAPGDEVKLGQTIGYVGCSAMVETALGDHLHFSVSHKDVSMDPQKFCEQS